MGYQKHSKTSKQADELANKTTMAAKINSYIGSSKTIGKTIDEVAAFFNIQTGTASARIIGLQNQGHIIKTSNTRQTRAGRSANIYVTNCHHIESVHGRAATKQQTPEHAIISELENENRRLRTALENTAASRDVNYAINALGGDCG